MKKPTLMLLASLCATLPLAAQQNAASFFGNTTSHDLSLSLNGGAGKIIIDDRGDKATDLGINCGLTLGYTYMFDEVSGLHTGVVFTYLRSGYSAETVNTSYTEQGITLRDNGTTYSGTARVTTVTHRIDEVYTSAILSLPVQYAFRYNGFWADLGLRLSLPLSISSSYTYGPSTAEIVYFDLPDVSYEATPIPYHALDADNHTGTYKAKNTSVFVDVDIEGGYRWLLDPAKNMSLYVGAYFTYALNSFGGEEESFLSFDADGNASFAGLLNSAFVRAYSQMTFGITASLHLGIGAKR